jgi:protein SCO1/2
MKPQHLLALCAFVAALFAAPAGVRAAQATNDNTPRELAHVGVDEHLDGQIPLDAQFQDQDGRAVRVGDLFGRKPAMLILAYHRCPVLCSMIQNAAATALKEVPWTVGKEFDVVVVSIDPKDTPESAAAKRKLVTDAYGRPGSESGFHYLVGTKTNIDRVADAVGFKYQYDERQDQYGHPAVVMLVKPNGQMARYLYGLEFNPKDIRLGLLEASNGKSISTVEKVILFCYHYDPQDGKYTLVATRVMQLGGVVTVTLLGGFLVIMWSRERRKSKDQDQEC